MMNILKRSTVKYFKVEKGARQQEYEVTWDNFVNSTNRKYPFEQTNGHNGKSFYAYCPHCENTVRLVGAYTNSPRKHAAHTGKTIKGFSEYDYFGYNHCIHASHRPAYNRDARKQIFDENAKYYYDLTRNNFDRVAYVLRKCLDVYLRDNILLRSLEMFVASQGFLSPYLTKANIPWMICDLGLSGQSAYGQYFKVDSEIYRAVEALPAAIFVDSDVKGYKKLLSQSGQFLDLKFRFLNHVFETDDDYSFHEYFEFYLDDMVNQENVIYETRLIVDQHFLINLIDKEATYRDKNLLKEAKNRMPVLF